MHHSMHLLVNGHNKSNHFQQIIQMNVSCSITYLGPANSVKTYLIWSSLNNDYIGSANVDAISTQAPGARIMLNNPVGNSVTFQLHQIVPSAVPGASADLKYLIISIRYND
jgi:hypothetical protein